MLTDFTATALDGSLPPIIVRSGDVLDLDAPGIYRLLSSSGELLYVGRTQNLRQRMQHHRYTQPWWPEVSHMEWIPVDNYAEAVALERDCIEREEPLHNVASRVAQAVVESLPDHCAVELARLYGESENGVNPQLDSYMLALRDAGWFLNSIAAPLGITRERVRQRVNAAQRDPSLSVPPRIRPRRKTDPKEWPALTADEAAELARLAPLAAQCRGKMPDDHPARQASERLSELFAEYCIRGVRRREIAAAAGVTTHAVNRRLQSHGYYKTPPSAPKYKDPSKVERATPSQCFRGHPYEGENVRFINGDASRRICRTCERIRVANYHARKRAAA